MLISVVLVLFVGEILPSAVFTGTNQIKVASKLAGMVKVLMWIFYPVAYPIAKLLDCVLGSGEDGDETDSLYNRGELAALIRIQYEERMAAKQRRRQALQESVPNFENFEHEAKQASAETSMRDLRQHFRRTSSIQFDELMMAGT